MTIDAFPSFGTARLTLCGFRRSDEEAFADFATHAEFWHFLLDPVPVLAHSALLRSGS